MIMQVQKRKRKKEKNDTKIREKKSKRSEKVQSSTKRSKVYIYQEKWLHFRSENSNTWGVLSFRAKGIKFFLGGGGGLKNEVKISLSCHFIVNALCDGQVITTN